MFRFALGAGVAIFLFCWPVCRVLRRPGGTMAGLVLGLLLLVAGGWTWGRVGGFCLDLAASGQWMVGCSWFEGFSGLEAWLVGLAVSIPGAIAGGTAGFLLAKRPLRP